MLQTHICKYLAHRCYRRFHPISWSSCIAMSRALHRFGPRMHGLVSKLATCVACLQVLSARVLDQIAQVVADSASPGEDVWWYDGWTPADNTAPRARVSTTFKWPVGRVQLAGSVATALAPEQELTASVNVTLRSVSLRQDRDRSVLSSLHMPDCGVCRACEPSSTQHARFKVHCELLNFVIFNSVDDRRAPDTRDFATLWRSQPLLMDFLATLLLRTVDLIKCRQHFAHHVSNTFTQGRHWLRGGCPRVAGHCW